MIRIAKGIAGFFIAFGHLTNWILGGLIHLATIFILFSLHGLLGAFIGLLLPFASEAYTLYRIVPVRGWDNLYSWGIGLYAVVFVCNIISHSIYAWASERQDAESSGSGLLSREAADLVADSYLDTLGVLDTNQYQFMPMDCLEHSPALIFESCLLPTKEALGEGRYDELEANERGISRLVSFIDIEMPDVANFAFANEMNFAKLDEIGVPRLYMDALHSAQRTYDDNVKKIVNAWRYRLGGSNAAAFMHSLPVASQWNQEKEEALVTAFAHVMSEEKEHFRNESELPDSKAAIVRALASAWTSETGQSPEKHDFYSTITFHFGRFIPDECVRHMNEVGLVGRDELARWITDYSFYANLYWPRMFDLYARHFARQYGLRTAVDD